MKRISRSKKITKASVIKGAGRGKKIKVPTVNFDPTSARGLKEGIYVCRVTFEKPYWGVLHFGPRPVFGEKDKSLEAHLFDFKEGKDAKTADVEVFSFIREIVDFAGVAQMLEAIKVDIKVAKEQIRELGNL